MKLTGANEENVLTLLSFNELHAPALSMRLEADLFSTKTYRLIAQTALEYIEKYSAAPRNHIYDLLEEQLRRGEDGKLLRRTLDAMTELDKELQPSFVLDKLDHFIEKRQLLLALENATDAAHADDLTAAKEALYTGTSNGPQTEGIWLSDPKRMLSFLEQREEDYFPSGIEVLDQAGVRPARKTMMLLIAPPKAGKSWYLVEVGKQSVMHHHSVLHITLENSEELTAQRYTQALFAMSLEKTRNTRVPRFGKNADGSCTSIRLEEFDHIPEVLNSANRVSVTKKLRRLGKRAKLLIKSFPTGTLTVAGLNAYLDSLKRTDNFEPDMLIVDYPDLMAVDGRNLRTDLGRIYINLRGVAVARNLALVAVTQAGRGSTTAKVLTPDMVAEDWSKIMTADTIITYSRTAAEKKINLARILVANARGVRDGFMALISQSYETGQFCLDSAYMNDNAVEALERLTGSEKDEQAED